jgi:hypothetical protein
MIKIFCIIVIVLTLFGVTLWAADSDGGDTDE